MRRAERESGFTLIELMIVVTIIGTLAAVAIPRYVTYMLSSQAAEVGNIGGLMVGAMQAYADAQSLNPLATMMLFKGTGLASSTATPPSNPLTNVLPQLALPGDSSFSYFPPQSSSVPFGSIRPEPVFYDSSNSGFRL